MTHRFNNDPIRFQLLPLERVRFAFGSFCAPSMMKMWLHVADEAFSWKWNAFFSFFFVHFHHCRRKCFTMLQDISNMRISRPTCVSARTLVIIFGSHRCEMWITLSSYWKAKMRCTKPIQPNDEMPNRPCNNKLSVSMIVTFITARSTTTQFHNWIKWR